MCIVLSYQSTSVNVTISYPHWAIPKPSLSNGEDPLKTALVFGGQLEMRQRRGAVRPRVWMRIVAGREFPGALRKITSSPRPPPGVMSSGPRPATIARRGHRLCAAPKVFDSASMMLAISWFWASFRFLLAFQGHRKNRVKLCTAADWPPSPKWMDSNPGIEDAELIW